MLVILQVGIAPRDVEEIGRYQQGRGQRQHGLQVFFSGQPVGQQEEKPGVGEVGPVVQHQVVGGQQGELGRQVQQVPAGAEDRGAPAFPEDEIAGRGQGRQRAPAQQGQVRLQAVGMHVERQQGFL